MNSIIFARERLSAAAIASISATKSGGILIAIG
jgi:hypothetical protein